jgi:hypothetical protein
MKFTLNFSINFIIFTCFIVENTAKEVLKCENKGCYEVIKVFTELLTTKINESDAVSILSSCETFDNLKFLN